jgi:predicted hydrolase (HD superfamily)
MYGARLACCTTWTTSATRTSTIARPRATLSSAWPTCYLREHGWSEEICRAILAHADYSGVQPENALEKTILAVDELSSFVVAVALVRASKSIFDVDVAAVKKKLKDKAFARAVNRADIAHGAELVEMSLDDLIGHVLTALRGSAEQLGIQGPKTEA